MTDSQFIPELGHAAFGQPWQEYECPVYLELALAELADWFYEHAWNEPDGCVHDHDVISGRYSTCPFGNYGAHFKNDVFEVESYSWNDEYEQPYNFKWRDLEVSWYKWLGRDTTCNRLPSVEETTEMLAACLQSLES